MARFRFAPVVLMMLSLITLGCSTDGDDPSEAAPLAPESTVSSASTTPPTTPPTTEPPARGLGRATPPATLVPAPEPTDRVRPGDLVAGDCIDIEGWPDPDLVELEEVAVVDCEAPHLAEVFARVSLNDDPAAPHPGDEHVAPAADRVCLERFEGYVGLRYVDARLEIVHLRPPVAAWVRGDRTVTCMVVNANFEPLVGSVAAIS